MIPVINGTDECFQWDIGQELTSAIRSVGISNGEMFMLSDVDVDACYSRCGNADLFGPDLSFTRNFPNADYIVALELVEHKLVPYQKGLLSPSFPATSICCNSVLQMKMRVRVIDLSCDCPKIILQEIFTSNYLVPKDAECLDYGRMGWGTRAFATTPYGQAHKRMIRDLICRIESVTWGQ